MADCSKLADNIVKIGMGLATREDVKTFDDMVLELIKIFPKLNRQGIADAFIEVQESRRRETTETQKKLMAIYNEPKIEKTTQAKIEELNEFLETGELPKKAKKESSGSDTVEMLKSIVYDLRKQLNRSEPARRKRLETAIADLEQKLKTGDILPKQKPAPAESKEIDKLIYKRDMMRKEIQDGIRSMKPLTVWQKAGKYIDLARLLMTTGEFSFALRQGGIYAISHPFKWSKAMVSAFKSFASAKGLYDVNKGIFARENAPDYNKSGLVLLHEGMSLAQSEEVIMNYWMDKLPVIRNFNRAAIGFFNTLRADMFDLGAKTLGRGRDMTKSEKEIWASYINVMSGRGNLGALEPIAVQMNRAFFSARYVASRFQMIGGAIKHPLMSIAGENKAVHRMIALEYIRLGLGLSAIFALGMAVGADVEEDPRSADFGKLRFGKRRLDVLMGHAQILRLMAQLTTGKTKSLSGEIRSLRGKDREYGSRDIMDVISDFGRSKLSPQLAFALNLATGERMTGEEVTLLNNVTQLLYPITYGDIYEVMKEEGMPTNVSLSVLTLLGMGLQTYNDENRYAKTSGILGI